MDNTYLCVWGEGYVNEDGKIIQECHGIPFFTEDNGFSHYEIFTIKNLVLGESITIRGLIEVMSVVRVA